MRLGWQKDFLKKVNPASDMVFYENALMSLWTTFKIGGPADLLLFPNSSQQLAQVRKQASMEDIPVAIIGCGSNLLVRDGGIRGLVIALRDNLGGIRQETNDAILAGAGVRLAEIAHHASKMGLSGLEFAAGIPGTLGGAVCMNAGAYGSEISSLVTEVQVLMEDGDLHWLPGSDLKFSYRSSALLHRPSANAWWLTMAKLKLNADDPGEIQQRMEFIANERSAKQPLQYPSAGSIFKRPEGYYTGKLIEECGLKGYSIGGAQVSDQHAGFIINRGGATATDVIHLIDYIREKVMLKFGVCLELEVHVTGVD